MTWRSFHSSRLPTSTCPYNSIILLRFRRRTYTSSALWTVSFFVLELLISIALVINASSISILVLISSIRNPCTKKALSGFKFIFSSRIYSLSQTATFSLPFLSWSPMVPILPAARMTSLPGPDSSRWTLMEASISMIFL